MHAQRGVKPAEPHLTDIPQIGFGPSLILLPFGSFGKVESSSLAKDGALFICPAVPSLKNADFPIIRRTSPLVFTRTHDNRTPYDGAGSGGGRSSAISRRMSANKCREMATSRSEERRV